MLAKLGPERAALFASCSRRTLPTLIGVWCSRRYHPQHDAEDAGSIRLWTCCRSEAPVLLSSNATLCRTLAGGFCGQGNRSEQPWSPQCPSSAPCSALTPTPPIHLKREQGALQRHPTSPALLLSKGCVKHPRRTEQNGNSSFLESECLFFSTEPLFENRFRLGRSRPGSPRSERWLALRSPLARQETSPTPPALYSYSLLRRPASPSVPGVTSA